jgi:hypothetical protein
MVLILDSRSGFNLRPIMLLHFLDFAYKRLANFTDDISCVVIDPVGGPSPR